MSGEFSASPPGASKEEVDYVIGETIESGLKRALKNKLFFKKQCLGFEEKYKLNSDTFLSKFQKGQLLDKSDYYDWYASKVGFDIWSKKYFILKTANLKNLDHDKLYPKSSMHLCALEIF